MAYIDSSEGRHLPDTSEKEGQSTYDTPSEAPRNVKGVLWAVVVLSILSSTFLFSLDNTIVADIQPAIVKDFESIEKLAWLPVAFLLGSASTNLTW